jgi:hypothetical protein
MNRVITNKLFFMQIKKFFMPATPHLVALLFFLVISAVYFYPLFEGKLLRANDSTVAKINAKEIADFRAREGKEPLWTNSLFCGMPAYLISTIYHGNLIRQVDRFLRLPGMPLSVVFLAMAGFYLLLVFFGVNPWLSVTGALAYGFSSFLFQVLAAGHNTQAIALAYFAPMIGGVYLAYRHHAIKGAIVTSVFLALEIQANHPQVTYYAMICLMVFIIVELVYSLVAKRFPGFIRTSLILAAPVALAIGINFGFLYTTYEYGKYSIRGKSDLFTDNIHASAGLDRDYITNWSYGIDETFNLLIPDYKGGSSSPFGIGSETVKALRKNNNADAAGMISKYWGTQPMTDGPHYAGAIIIFLFILGLIIIKGRDKWWLLTATLLSVALAWGKNFMPLTNLFIDFFPGYNKFRAVTMILVIAQFCIPLLGIIALRDIFSARISKADALKGLKIALIITGGFLLLTIIIPGVAGSFLNGDEFNYPGWLRSALVADRKALLRNDSIRSLLFIVAASGVIFAFLSRKLREVHATIILALLILVDLWSVDRRYLDAGRFEKPSGMKKIFTPSVADAAILKDKSHYRVLNLAAPVFSDNTPTSYFHKSVGGYHGAKLKRYQELIDSSLYRDLNRLMNAARKARSVDDLLPVFGSTRILNMLNTRYVIYNPQAPPLVNTNALGNAWFVEKPILVNDANGEIAGLNRIDPFMEAVIDRRFKDQVTAPLYPVFAGEKIELTSFKSNELIYKSSTTAEKLAVFSEIYYPAGWKCFVDGRERAHFRADYVLRAMIVPAGEHEIRFSFEPVSYITGNTVSLASSLLLALLITAYLAYNIFKKKREDG